MVHKKRKTPVVKNDVFAVHGWETVDGQHEVTVWDSKGRMKQKVFDDWEDAEVYAQKMAKKMKLKNYQVDTPSRPHMRVKMSDLKHVLKYR